MTDFPGYTQVADYGWLRESKRCWYILQGNPFDVFERIESRNKSRREVIADIVRLNNEERERFAKLFPDVEWVGFNPSPGS